MPMKDSHLQFQAWAQEYGPIYSLILGTKVMIVLSSPEVVRGRIHLPTILPSTPLIRQQSFSTADQQSTGTDDDLTGTDHVPLIQVIYSDRIDAYVGSTLASKDGKILTMRYGPRWRAARKLFHNILRVNVAETYVPYQSLESKQMLCEILDEPTAFLDSLKRYSNSLSAQMTYGWRTPSNQDPKMKLLFESLDEYMRLNRAGVAAMADFFPVLRLVPSWLMPTKAAAKKCYQDQRGLFLGHWNEAKQAIREGTAKPCQAVDLAKLQEKEGFSDEEAAFLIGKKERRVENTSSWKSFG